MLKIKDVVRLSDGVRYIVTNKVFYMGKNYYLFVDFDGLAKTKICAEEQTENDRTHLKEISGDDKLLFAIIKLFNQNQDK